MKITIKNQNKSSEIKYPCLMWSDRYEVLVLFTKPRCGIAITHQDRFGELYSEDWQMTFFTPFTGTVELSND